MRLPEQRLWDSFSSHIPKGVWLQRLENRVGVGMPDVFSIGANEYYPPFTGLQTWIELKAVPDPPKRDTTPVLGKQRGLEVEQLNWHEDWLRHGGRSAVLIGVGTGNSRTLHYVTGSDIRRVNGMDADALANFALTWEGIFSMLKP